jgi:non-specific serine/threonine protein kinase/serine/threonine-protein kinase
VLYELLAGSQPFDAKRGQEQPLDELIRRLREEEPPTPSNKVSSDRDTSSAAAEARGTEPRQLASLLRGDLDWITMKAMEKVRARRYGTPSELAADIRRYLDHEAIVARPASTGYRLRKYVRRHRVTVGVAAGLVMLLAAFSVLQAAQLRRTTRERDRANRITDFMTDMFKVSDPNEARGNSVTAREILDKASNDMGKGLAQDPEAQSLMMEVMARTYTNLGLYPRAYELAKNAFDSRTRLLGSDNPKTLESMTQLGWILSRQGHYPEAERLEREALARDRRILGPENPLTLETTDNMSSTREEQGHFDDVEKPEREVIEIATRTLGPESVSALRARGILGLALFNLGRYAEAEQEYRQLVDADRRVRGAEHPETLKAMDNLAVSLCVQGRLAEAEPMYRELLAAERRVLGPDHPYTATAMGNLLGILSGEGQWAEAEKLAREAVAVETRVLGPEHNRTLLAKSNLADILSSEGHAHEAEQLEREALEVWTREHGPEDSSTLFAESVLAGILVRGGHYAEGEKIARKIFPVEMRTLWPQHPYTLDTLQHLGMALAYTHRYAEASQLFRDQIEKTNNSKGQGDQFTVWYDFACAAVAANRPDEALQYLREAINRGYKNADGLMTDPDLKSLRDNPKFQQLVAQLKLPPHGTP